jgi:aromatic-L-amino-acid decarboxylase
LDADRRTAELLRRVNRSGSAYLTHTRVGGRYTIRLAVGSPQTQRHHVLDTWRMIADIATELETDER